MRAFRPTLLRPDMIERIEDNGVLYAIIIRHDNTSEKTQFYTSPTEPFQLAQFFYDKGKVFPAHEHTRIERTLEGTSEVLLIRKGKLKTDIYDVHRKYLGTWILSDGDLILILKGGHGFEVLTDGFNMIEIKQGPYLGEMDKTRFDSELYTSQRTLT